MGSNRLYESHSNMRMAAKDDGDTRYLKGRICCLQVYNKSLTKLEIIAVQNRTFQEEGRSRYRSFRLRLSIGVHKEQGGAPNDCFLQNICSEKQILPRILYYLRTAKHF